MMQWDREIRMKRDYLICREKLWNYWGTAEGISRFFGADQFVELKPGGAFEIYFLMDNEKGSKGSEDCKVLRIEPPHRIAFTWNAPPQLAYCRGQYTVVEVRLQSINDSASRLELLHQGFGIGEDWDACLAYFEKAWPMVLKSLGEAIGQDS